MSAGSTTSPPHAPSSPRREPPVRRVEPPAGWARRAEAGSVAALRFMGALYRVLGRRACMALLWPIVAYFFVVKRAAREASLDYLRTLWATPEGRHALGHEPGWRDVILHLHAFAENIVDRLVVWSGEGHRIDVGHRGSEHMLRVMREGSGALVLGAHLGSFDMLRTISERGGLTVNVLMFTRHAERINRFFEELAPGSRTRVIQLEPASITTAFEIKRCLDRGEFVGILADRTWRDDAKRSLEIDFLGRPARFPLGPFLLQAVLGCELLVSLCVRTGPARYEAMARPLVKAGPVPLRERRAHAEAAARAYARVLEELCTKHPLQWFNFFDFWAPGGERAA